MKQKFSDIKIPLDFIELGLELHIYGNRKDSLFIIDKQLAIENGESPFQILEGNFYNYYFKLNDKPIHTFQIRENIIVKNALREDVSEGRITPNIYVGNLPLTIYNKTSNSDLCEVDIEVLAAKLDNNSVANEDISYRKNYQFMLNDIAQKCTELLMQINSPITQNFEVNFNKDTETIYQRFAFVNTLINTDVFNEAIQRILSAPTTKWREEIGLKDSRSIRRLSSFEIKQFATRNNRVKLAELIGDLNDIPFKIESSFKIETTDTHENRFVKHALEVFLNFSIECKGIFEAHNYNKSKLEAINLVEKLENYLNHPFFIDIQRPTTLKLNSPALQRKSGYRELLNAWLQFDLAAKLIWRGGEDVYKAGKRDIAVLYEYWLFFILYDLIKSKFKLSEQNSYGHLIEPTKDGLNVMVKSGKLTALEGVFSMENRELHVKFSYNRTFEGGSKYNKKNSKNSFAGSWTKALRPDYTLSIWPAEISNEDKAEELEKIVHIHFDSKYKVQQFTYQTEVENDSVDIEENSSNSIDIDAVNIDSLEREKIEEKKGVYKNADLLKMHAYKDAIRRTGGAYILYPGTEKNSEQIKGFHEIIPGLGAFAIRPEENNSGIDELSDFIDKIILHFSNMGSQQRRLSAKIYEIHENDEPNIVNEPMPEYLIPDETYVLVGYCRNIENINWYKKNRMYNFRMNDDQGSLILENDVVNARYLLIREPGKTSADKLFKITSRGPKVFQGSKLEDYKTDNLKEYYLVVEIEDELTSDFKYANYDFTRLDKYRSIVSSHPSRTAVGMPFSVTLSELMNVKEPIIE